jgi:hypothetical protein
MMQRLKAVLQHPLLRRTIYLLGFTLGGYLCSGTPWLRWVYTEVRVALGSETFRAVVGSWPLAIVGSLLLFRRPIAERIRNLLRVGYKDAGLEFAAQQAQELPASTPALPSPDAVVRELPAAAEPPRDGVVHAVPAEAAADVPAPAVAAEALAAERQVDGFLASTSDLYVEVHDSGVRKGLEEGGLLKHPEQAIRLLIRFTSFWFVQAEFEKLYGAIWGAQIALLRELAALPMPMTQAASFVADWVARNQRSPDTIERWLGFLASFGVIEKKDNELHITQKGRSFLVFLARNGKPDPLPRY